MYHLAELKIAARGAYYIRKDVPERVSVSNNHRNYDEL